MKTLLATSLLFSSAIVAPAQASEIRDVMGTILAGAEDPSEINAKCDHIISAIEARRDQVLAGSGPATIGNTLVPYDEMIGLLMAGSGEFTLYSQVLGTAELRDAGGDCGVRLSALGSEINLSRPIFDRLSAVDLAGADPITAAYHADTMAGFERAGVALDDAGRARIQEIQEELAGLSQDIARNIAEDVRTVRATPEELAGVPQDFIDSREVDDEGYITLTTAYTDYQPVMSYAEDDDLRRRFSEAYSQRAWPQNDELLARMFTLRAEMAELLGRPDYATLALEDKMVNTPAQVRQLMAQTYDAALPAALQDYERNLAVLREYDPQARRIQSWQTGFLSTQAQQRFYDYDPQEARQYFAYNNVRDGVLGLTEDLFGVEIREWDTPVWHEDVEAYEMLEDGEVIGRFYFDNHPRPGKYTHANMIPIYPGIEGDEVPVGALVQNLPKGDHSTGLMEHSAVETLLHEFGHMLHGMFGGTMPWFGQNFLTMEWDVVEAPSQMLENWVYDYETLANFAVDAEGNTIPEDLVAKMNRVRNFNRGLSEMRQLGLTNVSLQFHRQPVPEDLGVATRAWINEYDLIPYPNYNEMQAAFSHLDGYSAFYYTYLWSRVVGADLFTRFEEEGIRNPQTAEDYRRTILEPGGSRPIGELIHEFLGRDVTLDAFRAELEADSE